MRYRLQIELQDKNRVAETERIMFSEDRWLTARIQALTVLADCYSENKKLLGLYLQTKEPKNSLRSLGSSADITSSFKSEGF